MTSFNRFDICEAYYMFASLNHGGQNSVEYAKFAQLERIGYQPSPLLCLESLSKNSREIYNNLVDNK